MEPQIRYATTDDGVRIAYWAFGNGLPLLYLPPIAGHIRLEWESDVFGSQFRDLATRYRVIRLDFRNTGLSERSATSDDSGASDIDAVLDHLGIDQVAIRVFGPVGLIAMTYAARRPTRVSALVLSECFASFKDIAENAQTQALISLAT